MSDRPSRVSPCPVCGIPTAEDGVCEHFDCPAPEESAGSLGPDSDALLSDKSSPRESSIPAPEADSNRFSSVSELAKHIKDMPEPEGQTDLEWQREADSSADISREQYERLKASGMMWEIHPEFTGDYHIDVPRNGPIADSTSETWYVTEYPDELTFAVTNGLQIIACIEGGKTVGEQSDLATRIAKLPQLERELAQANADLANRADDLHQIRELQAQLADARKSVEFQLKLNAEIIEREKKAIKERDETRDYAITKASELRQQLATATEALEAMQNITQAQGPGRAIRIMRKIAKQALAAINGENTPAQPPNG